MNLLTILIDRMEVLLILILCLGSGLLASKLLTMIDEEKALSLGERFDNLRKPVIITVSRIIEEPFGIWITGLLIFGLNLSIGSLLHFTLGSLLVFWSFIALIFFGFLTGLVLYRYPERLNWLAVVVIIFEFGAYITAAAGGVKIGVSIFTSGSVLTAIKEWALLFSLIVVPLQLMQGFSEAFLFRKVFVDEGASWPHDIGEETN